MARGQMVRHLFLAQGIVGSNPTAPAMIYHYSHRFKLMSPRERDFFSLLMDSVGHDYLVFPQMHLDNIFWYKFKG